VAGGAVAEEELSFAGHGGEALRALLVRPQGAAPEPRRGVVLVHGERGLDALVSGAAARLARAGCAVLAPELSAGAAGLSDRRALGHLERAAGALVERAAVDPERVAALGFASGGTLAFLFGCASTRVAAVVDFHGALVYPELSAEQPVQPLELALNLGAPLLAFFGESDPSIPPAHVARLRTALSQFAKDFDIVTYPGATHGFMDERSDGYDAAAAADAWQRTLAFLEERLA